MSLPSHILIDGDIVVYKTIFSVGDTLEWAAYRGRADSILVSYFERFDVNQGEIYLSSKNNFRRKHYPDYKANRKGTDEPPFLDDLKKYMVDEYGAYLCDGFEADDALGVVQSSFLSDSRVETCIVSIDKDLLQIPGWHYNTNNRTLQYIDAEQAELFYHCQLLAGDVADNIIGIRGIGLKTALKKFSGMTTSDRCKIIQGLYNDDQWLRKNIHLIRILRTPEELSQVTTGKVWRLDQILTSDLSTLSGVSQLTKDI